jgi:hypothetical protein
VNENDRLVALAEDVGRLRRRLRDESRDDTYLAFVAGRVAAHVESLDGMLFPTASELVVAGAAVGEALDTVDERTRSLRRLLGEET